MILPCFCKNNVSIAANAIPARNAPSRVPIRIDLEPTQHHLPKMYRK